MDLMAPSEGVVAGSIPAGTAIVSSIRTTPPPDAFQKAAGPLTTGIQVDGIKFMGLSEPNSLLSWLELQRHFLNRREMNPAQ